MCVGKGGVMEIGNGKDILMDVSSTLERERGRERKRGGGGGG